MSVPSSSPNEGANPDLERQNSELKNRPPNTNARFIPQNSKIDNTPEKITPSNTPSPVSEQSSSNSKTIDLKETSKAILQAVRQIEGNLQYSKSELAELCQLIGCNTLRTSKTSYSWIGMLVLVVLVALLGYFAGNMRKRTM